MRINYITPEDYLAHHGVKGQRWGVRRYQPYSGDKRGDEKEVGEAAKKRASLSTITKNAKKMGKREINKLVRQHKRNKKAREKAKEEKKNEKNNLKQVKKIQQQKEKPKQSISSMSDMDLNNYIRRLQTEKTAMMLYEDVNYSSRSKARQFVSNALNRTVDKAIEGATDGVRSAVSRVV